MTAASRLQSSVSHPPIVLQFGISSCVIATLTPPLLQAVYRDCPTRLKSERVALDGERIVQQAGGREELARILSLTTRFIPL